MGPTEKFAGYIKPIPCKNKEVYNELNSLIYEYLEVNGLEQALSTFSQECRLKNLPCPQAAKGETHTKPAFTHYDGELLLKSFDEGNLESFLKLWKHFQTHIQVTSEDMKKLEVYIRVHFAIWPKAKNESEEKQAKAMQQLRTFFEEHSESLSSDATILPLFALPYVSEPRPHPIFKDLFQDNWTIKLRTQLETTVNKYFELLQENINIHCKLAAAVAKSKSKLYQHQTGSLPSDLSPNPKQPSPISSKSVLHPSPQPTMKKCSTQNVGSECKLIENYVCEYNQLFEILGVHKKLRKVLKDVRENYGKLLRVCAILLNALENPVQLPFEQAINQCYLIYPDIFTNPSSLSNSSILSTSSNKPDIEHFKKLAAAASNTSFNAEVSEVGLLFAGISDVDLRSVNFAKIKTDLTGERLQPTEKLCLLQALRWLVTKTGPAARSQVMLHYMQSDILGLADADPEIRNRMFASFLSPTPTYQKESLSRLINALASTWAGRSYLTTTDFAVDVLIRSLSTFTTQEESFICHMVIATLQKLSLRRKMRHIMIERNVIPWLVSYIKIELDRDLVREEVDLVLLEEAATLSNINNNGVDVSYGDTTFNNYLMEYAWALLMNLCLHPESIKSASTVDFEFLHCIVTMLTSTTRFTDSNSEFIPYVLSTLFSLLRSPEMFEKAKSMKFDQKLGEVIEHQPPEIANHMKHLLTQLYEKEDVDRLMALGETDYDDSDNPDPDELESELELQESWMTPKNETGLLTGDDLLIREYILNASGVATSPGSEDTVKKECDPFTNDSNSVDHLMDSKINGMHLRPITPTHARAFRTSTLNDSCRKVPSSSTTAQLLSHSPGHNQQTYLQTRLPTRGRASSGEVLNPLTPQPPNAKYCHQKTVVNHLLRPIGGQMKTQQLVQLGTQEEEKNAKEPLQQSATSQHQADLFQLLTPMEVLLAAPHSTNKHANLNENLNRDTSSAVKLTSNEAGSTSLTNGNSNSNTNLYHLHESPLIIFDNEQSSSSSSKPSPQYEKKSILISYLDYDDSNNNLTGLFKNPVCGPP